MPRFAARRPNDHHHAPSQKPDRLKAPFAINETRILGRKRKASEHFHGVGKIQTPG